MSIVLWPGWLTEWLVPLLLKKMKWHRYLLMLSFLWHGCPFFAPSALLLSTSGVFLGIFACLNRQSVESLLSFFGSLRKAGSLSFPFSFTASTSVLSVDDLFTLWNILTPPYYHSHSLVLHLAESLQIFQSPAELLPALRPTCLNEAKTQCVSDSFSFPKSSISWTAALLSSDESQGALIIHPTWQKRIRPPTVSQVKRLDFQLLLDLCGHGVWPSHSLLTQSRCRLRLNCLA